MTATTERVQIPIVDYLRLGDDPHLAARSCDGCGAVYFDRRNACASCGQTAFSDRRVVNTGEVVSFTIVHFAAPGVPVPFAALIVDCAGVHVRANMINIDPTPDNIALGMRVQLATYSMGVDSSGAEGIGFGFEPEQNPEGGERP